MKIPIGLPKSERVSIRMKRESFIKNTCFRVWVDPFLEMVVRTKDLKSVRWLLRSRSFFRIDSGGRICRERGAVSGRVWQEAIHRTVNARYRRRFKREKKNFLESKTD